MAVLEVASIWAWTLVPKSFLCMNLWRFPRSSWAQRLKGSGAQHDFIINPLPPFFLLAAQHAQCQDSLSDLDTLRKHTLEGLATNKICPFLTLQLKEGMEKSKQNPQYIFPQSYLSSCWSRARNTPVGTSGLPESPGQWGPQGCCSLTCPVLGLCQQS